MVLNAVLLLIGDLEGIDWGLLPLESSLCLPASWPQYPKASSGCLDVGRQFLHLCSRCVNQTLLAYAFGVSTRLCLLELSGGPINNQS